MASLLGYTKSYVGNGKLRKELMSKVLEGDSSVMRCMGFTLEEWMKKKFRKEYQKVEWKEFGI